MAKMIVFLCIMGVSLAMAMPAKKEALDQATALDVNINSVNPEQKTPAAAAEDDKQASDTTKSSSDVHLSDISFGTPLSTTNHKPGFAVARIIDDIFQIPIGVLQSVARLLRNPFISHKTPETTASY